MFLLEETPIRTFRCDNIVLFRGLACLYVFLCHFLSWEAFVENDTFINELLSVLVKFTQPMNETNSGVIFFIVLSGYCIHRSKPVNRGIMNFYRRRFIKIYPVFFAAMLLGVLLLYLTNDKELTYTLTQSRIEYVSFFSIGMRLTGVNVLFPYEYTHTYLGNAILITVLVELYLYLLYPLLVRLDKNGGYYIFGIVALWVVSWLYSIKMDYTIWWQNASLIMFLPLFIIGMIANHDFFTYCKRNNIIVLFLIVLFFFSYYLLVGTKLPIIAEVRKLILAMLFAFVIRFIDVNKTKPGNYRGFGIYDLGQISYSIYAIHGPVIVFLIGLKVDMISILVVVFALAFIWSLIFERGISRHLLMRLQI